MGWSSGSKLMSDFIAIMQAHVPDFMTRFDIYMDMFNAMEMHDWDTQDECRGLDAAYDLAFVHRYCNPGEDVEGEQNG